MIQLTPEQVTQMLLNDNAMRAIATIEKAVARGDEAEVKRIGDAAIREAERIRRLPPAWPAEA